MPAAKPTHYVVLGVPESADAETIERAYKARIGATHPDRARDEKDRLRRTRESATVNESGRVLRDQTLRVVYDYDLAAERRAVLAQRLITARPSPSVSHPATRPAVSVTRVYTPPETVSESFSQEPTADNPYEPWGVPAPLAVRGSWADLKHRVGTAGARDVILAFVRFNPIGQWLTVLGVWLTVTRAQAVFWPETVTDLWPRFIVLGIWLMVGAFWARSWARHPLGHLLRFIGSVTDAAFDSLGNRGQEEER